MLGFQSRYNGWCRILVAVDELHVWWVVWYMISTEACSDFITEDRTRNHICSCPKFKVCITLPDFDIRFLDRFRDSRLIYILASSLPLIGEWSSLFALCLVPVDRSFQTLRSLDTVTPPDSSLLWIDRTISWWRLSDGYSYYNRYCW